MKQLLIILILSVVSFAQVKTTVTAGTIQDTTGNAATSGYVQFDIQPTSSGLNYSVPGVGAISTTGQCSINGSGQLSSCGVWGTGVIVPANTTYCATYFPNGVETQRVCQLNITGASFDLTRPVFAPIATIIPQYNTITTSPISANIVPAANSVFTLGNVVAHFSQLWVDTIFGVSTLALSNLTVSNLESIRFADQSTGSDCGQKIVNACTSTSTVYVNQACGTSQWSALAIPDGCHVEVVEGGTYNIGTITVGNGSSLTGTGIVNGNAVTNTGPTLLSYAATSGTAITTATGVELRDFTLQGPGLGAAGTSVGIIPSGAIYNNWSNVDISNFKYGLQFGNGTYVASFNNLTIHDNATSNLWAPPGLTQFGENITLSGGSLSNKGASFSTTCANLQSATDIHLNNVSLDQCGFTSNGVDIFVYLNGVHVENPNGATSSPFFTFGANCNICTLTSVDGYWVEDLSSARTEFIKNASTVVNAAVSVSLTGGVYAPFNVTTQLVNSTSACCGAITISGIQNGIGGNQFTNLVGGSWFVKNIVDSLGNQTLTGNSSIGGNQTVTGTLHQVGAATLDGALGVAGLSTLTGGVKAGASGSTISDTRELLQSVHNCGTTATCSNTSNGSYREVFGSVPLTSATPSTATITGISPAFTSTSTYECTCSPIGTTAAIAAGGCAVSKVSASSFTLTGPATVTTVVSFSCKGN